MQRVGAASCAFEREAVLLEEIEDGDLALVLDVGVVAADRGLVERDLDRAAPASGQADARRLRPASVMASLGRFEPDGDGAAMGLEPLGPGQRHGGGAERREAAGIELQDARCAS